MFIASVIAFASIITKADMDIVARVVAGEARNQRTHAVEGVCHVIYNRAKRTGASLSRVVTARLQFSALNRNDPNRPIIMAHSFKRTRSYDRVGRICRDVFTGRQLSSAIDVTEGADHYYSGDRVPYWARGRTPTAHIGAFKFFRLGYRPRHLVQTAARNGAPSVRRASKPVVTLPSRDDRRALDALFKRLATRTTQ